jgi:hypothetical protein
MNSSPHGQFAPWTVDPWTVHPMDSSLHGQFSQWTVCPTDNSPHGQLAPQTVRPMDKSPHGQLAPSTTRPMVGSNIYKLLIVIRIVNSQFYARHNRKIIKCRNLLNKICENLILRYPSQSPSANRGFIVGFLTHIMQLLDQQ